jgi:hypothetical protein
MLTPNMAITFSAVYTRSWNKQFTIDTNLVWNEALNNGRGGYTRPDPNFRRVTQLQLAAPAEYIGGIVEIERRGARMGATGNLTFSRSRGVEGIDTCTPINRTDSEMTTAPSRTHPRFAAPRARTSTSPRRCSCPPHFVPGRECRSMRLRGAST